jgi:hypothetical protein
MPARIAARQLALAAVTLGAGAATGAFAVTCTVPSASHPTVGAAVRDADCTLVQLAAGTFPENVAIARDLALSGTGSTWTAIEGYLTVSGAGVDLAVDALRVDGTAPGVAGCWAEVLLASGGGKLTAGADLSVLNTAVGGAACRIFDDGFESGGVLAWSGHVP